MKVISNSRMDILCLLDIKILWVRSISSLYACLFRKCCILVRVDATHQSSTTTSRTPSDPNFSAHKAGHSGSNIGSNIDAT